MISYLILSCFFSLVLYWIVLRKGDFKVYESIIMSLAGFSWPIVVSGVVCAVLFVLVILALCSICEIVKMVFNYEY